MDKLIGFTVSRSDIDHTDVDVFNSGLKCIKLQYQGFQVYLWGIGDISKCIVNEKYTLSFPLIEDLLDRNVLIYFKDGSIIVENDWLGSIPVFYNEVRGIVSTLSLKTLTGKEIHPEGLANFVEFGYSILEQTPFKEVKFMRYYSKLVIDQDGIKVHNKEDPVLEEGLFDKITDETTVFTEIKNYINKVEAITTDEIILPTSGGYDSRLLNLCIDDKSRIRSYTYGISDEQSKSFEVVHAKKISEILGTQWKRIELGKFNRYINDWFKIFGMSTHLHGMYHIEFYKKILEKQNFGHNVTFLSGIVGDAWTGNIKVGNISSYKDITKLAYAHGLNADKNQLLLQSNDDSRKIFYIEHQDHLKKEKIRIIFLIRFKMILLSYLTTIPEYFGMPVWTPFLNFDNVVSMLNLPEKRRDNRKWQEFLFSKNHLDLENMNLNADKSNSLDYQAFINETFEPLDIQLMSAYFNTEYIKLINYVMLEKCVPPKLNKMYRIHSLLSKIPYCHYFLKRMGIYDPKFQGILIASPYYVVKTVELGLNGLLHEDK